MNTEELKPLASLFEEIVSKELKVESASMSADTTTVSSDGCAWSDPWKG